VADKQEWTRQ